MYLQLCTCMIILALECSFACCDAGPRVFIHLYYYMHWAIIGVPCSGYMNMETSSYVCIYFYHYKMQSNYDVIFTTILMTISTFRCLMQVNTNMKKARTHFFFIFQNYFFFFKYVTIDYGSFGHVHIECHTIFSHK